MIKFVVYFSANLFGCLCARANIFVLWGYFTMHAKPNPAGLKITYTHTQTHKHTPFEFDAKICARSHAEYAMTSSSSSSSYTYSFYVLFECVSSKYFRPPIINVHACTRATNYLCYYNKLYTVYYGMHSMLLSKPIYRKRSTDYLWATGYRIWKCAAVVMLTAVNSFVHNTPPQKQQQQQQQ